MKSASANGKLSKVMASLGMLAFWCLVASGSLAEQPAPAATAPVVSAEGLETFATPQQAAAALIEAAEKFDLPALLNIFGPGGEEVVLTGEYPKDRQRALDFAAEARKKTRVSVDPKSKNLAYVVIGDEDWQFPVPIVKRDSRWQFDAAAGLRELEYRRVGANELDAIQLCRGYVEAQYEYAFGPRQGYDVNQYAQYVISAPGKQDGLAWQNPDGSWGGPIGESVARAIQQGYTGIEQGNAVPYRGYFFKVLKGQGPDAPLGELDYLVKGVMIGGFALVAVPAEYGQTGLMSFIVSQDGVVYQKDLGPRTLQEFKTMERFNPDRSWTPVAEDE